MSDIPAAASNARPVAGSPATVEDLVATLAAMQDQIDDLTAVVEAHARRIAELQSKQGSDQANDHANGSTVQPGTRPTR